MQKVVRFTVTARSSDPGQDLHLAVRLGISPHNIDINRVTFWHPQSELREPEWREQVHDGVEEFASFLDYALRRIDFESTAGISSNLLFY
ncbi:MAG: hypothetical protein WA642_12190 [Steroidobacteraceae bacterium]